VFAKITARSEYVLTRRKNSLLPLALDAWREYRDKDKAELEKLDAKLDEGPERFSVKLVDYRPVAPSPSAPARESSKTRVDKWQENLARDPWVEEALNLVLDMSKKVAPKR
jgi:hypothetical protein